MSAYIPGISIAIRAPLVSFQPVSQPSARETMDKLYTPNPDGYCGDEDNGQTSAWYVFSALGFYPVCPGSNQYVLGTPLFKHVRINLENGNAIEILADNNSRANRYINSMSVNGKPYDANFLTHDQLTGGAKITYEMSPTPNLHRGTSPASAPYSFSDEPR